MGRLRPAAALSVLGRGLDNVALLAGGDRVVRVAVEPDAALRARRVRREAALVLCHDDLGIEHVLEHARRGYVGMALSRGTAGPAR